MLQVKYRPKQIDKNVLCLDTYVIRDPGCIGYCCSDPTNLESKINIAAQAGYEAVELWHRDVSGYIQKHGLRSLLGLLEKNQLFVASYKVLEGWFEGKSEIEPLQTAASINARCCVVKFIGDNCRVNPMPLPWYRQRYMELLDIADKLKINPAVEFMALSPYMNKIEDVYELLAGIPHPRASLVLDTWHLWRKDDENFSKFEQSFHKLNPRWISVVHFTDTDANIPQEKQVDGHRKLPKSGKLNLEKFCRLLKPSPTIYSLNVYDRSLWNQDPMSVATKGRYLMQQCLESDWSREIGDCKNWRERQTQRCDALWFKQYHTHLDPRVKATNRNQQLKTILAEELTGKVVLDFKCGFSPLAEYMSYGFDAYQGCVDYLAKNYPQSKWTCASDEEFSKDFNEKIDVLVHLGLGDSNTEVESHFKVRSRCQPSVVIIECATNADGTIKPRKLEHWNALKKDLKEQKQFVLNTDMPEQSHRLLLVGKYA